MAFWDKLRIRKATLIKFNVEQVDSVNGYAYTNSYIYLLPKGRYRVYSPKSRMRFWGTMKQSDIFGLEQLPETGDLLIITKSLKDVMVLTEMGYNAISFSSETVSPTKKVIDELKARFRRIVILYDNDKTGIEQSERLRSIHKLDLIYMQSAKDISDCVIKIGFEESEEELHIQLNTQSTLKKAA